MSLLFTGFFAFDFFKCIYRNKIYSFDFVCINQFDSLLGYSLFIKIVTQIPPETFLINGRFSTFH